MGVDYTFNQNSYDMTQKLKTILIDNKYSITCHLKKEASFLYSFYGSMQAYRDLSCARCAHEFKDFFSKSFKERLFVQDKHVRKAKETKNNHFSELIHQDNFVIVHNFIFDIGEFFHEILITEDPLRPLANLNCDNKDFHCEHFENMKEQVLKKDQAIFF